jgi:predicted membrane GTPase involved in stress response
MTEFMEIEGGRTKMTFLIPTRGLLGFRAYFQNETRGSGICNHVFHGYAPFMGAIDRNPKGALISSDDVYIIIAAFILCPRFLHFSSLCHNK